MLKLSGWPRLTWGRGARAGGGGRSSPPLSLRPSSSVGRAQGASPPRGGGATTSGTRRVAGPTLVAPRPAPGEVGRRSSARRAAGGQSPRPAARARAPERLVRVTPRQACPRPGGLGRNLRSKTRWFTGFCNSHQVSHFATFFIDARAEISVAESRATHVSFLSSAPARGARGEPLPARRVGTSMALPAPVVGSCPPAPSTPAPPRRRCRWGAREDGTARRRGDAAVCTKGRDVVNAS
ncbi:hypothetical protein IHE45_14G051000 [Dioscorea alata]|uniref:Uncharacterized protein n=1 Tax=Dioscorea alata TaxID=55571 RepID=A0ACB7URV4_DIOAL|nr:hypothetical protein IHE45_14G051000 [Dioscorea alata]